MSDIVNRLRRAHKHDGLMLPAEAADRIQQLERELASARETNRKLHRRAQLAEAASQCAPDYLKAWLEVLTRPGRNRERRLVLWIIRDIQDRFAKLSERARRLAEQEGTE